MSASSASSASSARRLAVVLGAAAAISSAACAAIFGFDRLDEAAAADAGPDAQGPDGATDAGGADGASACLEIGVPAPPAATGTASDGGDTIRHVAIKTLDFGLDTTAAPPGYNLDMACTTSTATSTCLTNVDPTTFGRYVNDVGSGGVDNAGFPLIQDLSFFGASFEPSSILARLQNGEFGVVLRVSNWNGTPNDDSVIVEIFPALGVKSADGGATPDFASSDQWVRDARFVLTSGLDDSTIESVTAYVTGGKVAAFFQSVTLSISVPDDPKLLDIKLSDVWTTGDLVTDANGDHIGNGVLAGRWKTSDFFDQTKQIFVKDTIGLTNTYLCNSDAATVYALLKSKVCGARDIAATSAGDGKGGACDAISVALRFDTYALDSDGPLDASVNAPRCASGVVPPGDDCP